MLLSVEGFFITIYNPGVGSFEIPFTYPSGGPLPPGRSAYANIALSSYNPLGSDDAAVAAFIDSWTVYNPDGTLSNPIQGRQFPQNSVTISNCATINFFLGATRAYAIAQINVFVFG